MTENQNKNPVTKSLAQINPLIDLAIFCTQAFQDKSAKCPECGQGVRTIEIKEVERQDKTSCSLKFIGSCLHIWRITLFQIGGEAFEGEFKCKGKSIEFLKPTGKETQKEEP
jgi:hypothetical protein